MTARFPPISRRAVAGSIAAVCAALALGGNALANTWPEKTVTLVVPYSAGGPTAVVARLLAVPMGQSLGQTVVVENTVGAGYAGARAHCPVQTRWLHHPDPPHGHGHGPGALQEAAL